MKNLGVVLLLWLAALQVRAEQPIPASLPIILTQAMRVKPPLTEMTRAFFNSGMSDVSTKVDVAYDAEGNVLGVKLEKPTGSEALDKAIMAWAAQVKIETQDTGFGSIPVNISR